MSYRWVFASLLVLLALVGDSFAVKSYHKQLCVVTEPACRVPFEDRPVDKIRTMFTPDKKQVYPKGHLRPVGHKDFEGSWEGEIPTYKEGEHMTPDEFWTKYYPSEPFILKGVGKSHAAYKTWQSDEYIAKKFGHIKAKAENKNEDRLTDYCGMVKLGDRVRCDHTVKPYEESFLNISRFMKNYLKPGYDKYIISQLPDDMAKEVGVVPAWYCGSRHPIDKECGYNHNDGKSGIMDGRPWLTQLYESNIWINYNKGKEFSSSVIHYDMNHQMMCLYAGKKEWITWDSAKHINKIPMWSELLKSHNGKIVPPHGSDDSPVDPERVDLEEFPDFAKAGWRNTTMEPGDCMYLPAWHLHYVRSWERNIAGMYMFQTGTRYDPSVCKDVPTTSTPLGDFDILWNFPGAKNTAGYNQVKMGYPDWKRYHREGLARHAGGNGVDKRTFVQWYAHHVQQHGDDSDDGDSSDGSDPFRMAANIFDAVAGGKQTLPVKELYCNPKMAELFRTIAVGSEGRGEQEMDSRIMRFSLTGSGQKKVRDDL